MVRVAVRAPGCTPPNWVNRRALGGSKAYTARTDPRGSAGSDDDRRGAGSGVTSSACFAHPVDGGSGPGGDRRLRGARLALSRPWLEALPAGGFDSLGGDLCGAVGRGGAHCAADALGFSHAVKGMAGRHYGPVRGIVSDPDACEIGRGRPGRQGVDRDRRAPSALRQRTSRKSRWRLSSAAYTEYGGIRDVPGERTRASVQAADQGCASTSMVYAPGASPSTIVPPGGRTARASIAQTGYPRVGWPGSPPSAGIGSASGARHEAASNLSPKYCVSCVT